MNQRSTKLTLWINRGMMLAVALLLPLMPRLLLWYNTVRILDEAQNLAIMVAYCCCAPVALYALWRLDRLLRNILASRVFVRENARIIGHVCLCCALVSLICLLASFYYPPLLFMSVVMGFLCPVVAVVRQVLRAAVDIKEENELTI